VVPKLRIMMLKNGLIILSSILVLGTKGCEENNELDIIEMPGTDIEEINTDADIPVIAVPGGEINTKEDIIAHSLKLIYCKEIRK
jgi:hypothetical protein